MSTTWHNHITFFLTGLRVALKVRVMVVFIITMVMVDRVLLVIALFARQPHYLPAATLAGLIPKPRAHVAAPPVVVHIVELATATMAQIVAEWLQWGRCVEQTHCHATSHHPMPLLVPLPIPPPIPLLVPHVYPHVHPLPIRPLIRLLVPLPIPLLIRPP